MGTGLIYAAIVAVWAAYLVPLWLRQHDEEVAARPSEPAADPRARVLPRRRRRQATHGTSVDEGAERVVSVPTQSRGDGPPAKVGRGFRSRALARSRLRRPSFRRLRLRRRGLSPAARRRRTVVALLMLTVVVWVLAILGRAPVWAPSVPFAATLAMLVVSAVAARRARRGASRAAERRVRVVAQRTASPRRSSDGRPRPTAEQQSTGASAERLLPPPRPAPRRSEARDDGRWDPVEVPLPLYLSKAKAPRTVRTVELGSPGTWTSGRLPGREQESRSVESRDVLLDASEPSDSREGNGDVPESARRRAVGD